MTAVDETRFAGPTPPVRKSAIAGKVRMALTITAIVDLSVLAFSVLLAWNLRLLVEAWGPSSPGAATLTARTAPVIVALWLGTLFAHGAYARRSFAEGPDEYRLVAKASATTAGLVGLGCYLLSLPLSRGFMVITFLVGTPLLLLGRYMVRQSAYSLRRSGRLLRRVVAVGGASAISEVVEALRRDQYVGYQVVGACLPEGAPSDGLTVPVVGRTGSLREVCEEVAADTVLVARGGFASSNELRRIAWELEGSNIDLVVVPSLTDVAGPRISMRPVAGLPLLHVEQPQSSQAAGIEKRLFDLFGAVVALGLLAPVMLLVALLIRLEDKGPVLFRQPRIGRDGETFGCYKFRSMFVDADKMEESMREESGHSGALWKLERDPRITRIGSFIRRYSLDELPQLFNVVTGDMSLVGPRPQQAWEVETYTEWEGRRLRVRPGMTGLWQVSGRSQLSFEEAIRLDLYYVDNWSMTADLVIMAKTAKAVVGKTGAY